MITDPNALRVLCFGDSGTYGTCLREASTYGTPTRDPDYVRLDADRRWTGVLQRMLGEGCDVIEEGLNGRTTDMDDEVRPGLNGRTYFVPCLLSHQPLDLVVVMLGGNDLKPSYGRTPETIADALGRYVDDVATHATDRHGQVPATMLVGPTLIDDSAPRYRDLVGDSVPPDLPARFRRLATAMRRSQRTGVWPISTPPGSPTSAGTGSISAWTRTPVSRSWSLRRSCPGVEVGQCVRRVPEQVSRHRSSVRDSTLPSGSVNQATRSPFGVVQTPWTSCPIPS